MQLYTPIEIEQIQEDIPFLVETIEWVKSFLAKPHAELGRSGSVCPYISHAIKTNSIQLAVIRGQDWQSEEVEKIVLHYRNIFLEQKAKEKETAIYKTFLLIFPHIKIEDASKLIDGVQKKLKPLFVDAGLMIGEFHLHNESPGLHNPNFRPFRSPIPILAIRAMLESDLPFLVNVDDLTLRKQYLETYLQRFGKENRNNNNLNNTSKALDWQNSN